MRYYKKIGYTYLITFLLIATGCSKLLQEQPRSQITPAFFSTPAGILGGIAGVYSDMRNLWGTEGFTNITLAGTDEYLAGGSASGTWFWTYNGLAAKTDDMDGLWGIAYQDINTLNGVLQFGAAAGLDSTTRNQYLAQAKFLRAFYYFYLVQTFGDVPLHLTFVTVPSQADTRTPIKDVYTQIIKDFTDASTQLSPTPTAPFLGKPATQAAALYFLAKMYLTRGWSSAAQSGDFQTAYNIANTLITNKATYGVDLWQDYNDANKPGNEYGKETLFVVDRESDLKYGERTTGSRASGAKENGTCFFFRPNYPTVNANYPASGGGPIMTRDIANGRPFIRIRPNVAYSMNVAFAERANDSRYDKTFQTTWIANTPNVTTPRGTLRIGIDTGIWMPGYEVTDAQRAAFTGVIFSPSNYTTVMFPSMKKYDDPNRADVNDASTRPFIFAKFSDVYLVAAEAAFKAGDNTNAAAMLNVVRQRAAYRTTNTPGQNAAAATAMVITPGQVTLDFILEERTRELYGECQRWWDLVRTHTLADRLSRYNPTEAYPGFVAGGQTGSTYNYTLRPVPFNIEISLITEGTPFLQNPGY